MAGNINKELLGKEDIQFDTPGAGSESKYTRMEPDGTSPVDAYTRLSAAHLPVLDAPVTTGSTRTPFSALDAADRDVEACLAETRKNARELKNFEHYGGVSGAGVSAAVAAKNSEVWRKIMDDLATEWDAGEGRKNGVFFPGGRYEFMEISGATGLYGSHVIPFQTSGAVNLGGIVVAGTPETTLAMNANANKAKNLLHSADGYSLFFLDLQLEHFERAADPTGRIVGFDPTAAIMFNLHFDKCSFDGGLSHIWTDVEVGGFYTKDIWITGCTFGDAKALSPALVLTDVTGIKMRDCLLSGINSGIALQAVSNLAGGDYELSSCRLTNAATPQHIAISNTGGGTVHNTINLSGISISDGDIKVSDYVAVNVLANWLFSGGIKFAVSGSGSVYAVRIEKNSVTSGLTGTDEGIFIDTASDNFRRLWINQNDVYNPGQHGIRIRPNTSTAKIHGMECNGNMILDPGLTANTYDGILVDAGHATAAVLDSHFLYNRMRSTNASFKMRRGITEEATSGHARNKFLMNKTKGWGTAAYSLASVNADAIDQAGAVTGCNYDDGTGV
jgi:hypothetical protein